MVNPYISPEYCELNQQLLRGASGFGGGGHRHGHDIAVFARALKAGSILDYGCGLGRLRQSLTESGWFREVREYDPAVLRRDKLPEPADVVACVDVLEHVEPDRLDAVCQHLRSVTRLGAYLFIATHLSNKTLADGRNAHLIVRPAEWWIAQFTRPEWRMDQAKWHYRKDNDEPRGVSLWLRPR